MEEVNKRIIYKDISIGDRTFRLNKFDPLTGSYMLFKFMGILAPIFSNIDVKDAKEKTKDSKDVDITGEDITKILGEMRKIPKEDFDYIQKECLKVVNEIYPNNPKPSPSVIDDYGEYGILDVDTPLIINLTIQSLIFNLSGFFGEKLSGFNLEGLTSSLQNLLT